MKKIISVLMSLTVAVSSTAAFAQKGVTVMKDGEKFNINPEPYIDIDVTMMPMRAIFESADADISWDKDTQTVIALYGTGEEQKSLVLQIGCDYAFLNGIKVSFKKPAVIVGDSTYVPLRAINEALGYNVSWDQQTYTVSINTK